MGALVGELVGRSWLGALMLALACWVAGCISAARPQERLASLKVIAKPEDTVVYINGRFAGTARSLAKRPKARKPGVAYVTFSAPGHFPHDVRLDLPPGVTTVKIALRQVPP
ncbi:MAG: hypothetical protein OXU20_16165 [Myxococcales bacterium]|nr:hypothetical protein [Myxococcales bacterium]MDD9969625.1 hypothetical protein [Myxococcales bacterium]